MKNWCVYRNRNHSGVFVLSWTSVGGLDPDHEEIISWHETFGEAEVARDAYLAALLARP